MKSRKALEGDSREHVHSVTHGPGSSIGQNDPVSFADGPAGRSSRLTTPMVNTPRRFGLVMAAVAVLAAGLGLVLGLNLRAEPASDDPDVLALQRTGLAVALGTVRTEGTAYWEYVKARISKLCPGISPRQLRAMAGGDGPTKDGAYLIHVQAMKMINVDCDVFTASQVLVAGVWTDTWEVVPLTQGFRSVNDDEGYLSRRQDYGTGSWLTEFRAGADLPSGQG